MYVRRCAAVAGALLVFATACATPAGEPGGPTPPASSGSAPPRPSGTIPPSPAPQEITVRGRVEEGVEVNCTVLRADDNKTYLLIGADPTIATPGARVEVVGDVRIDLLTTCMQGTPLAVRQTRRI